MTKKRDRAGDVATADDGAANTTPILTPRLTEDEAVIVAEYCKLFRASKGAAVLVMAVEAMRAALAARRVAT